MGWRIFLPRYIIEAQQHHVVHICQKTAGELHALQLLKARLHVPSLSPFFIQFKMGPSSSMELYTQNVKKIKGAARKHGDVDGTCKRALT